MKKLNFKNHNQGMSVLEVIVTMLIVGILATFISVNALAGQKQSAMLCAKNIAVILDKARVEAMTKVNSGVGVKIFADDEGYYASIVYSDGSQSDDVDNDTQFLGKKDLCIYINNNLINAKDSVFLKFDKSSGGFLDNRDVFQDGSGLIRIAGTDHVNLILVQRTGSNYIE